MIEFNIEIGNIGLTNTYVNCYSKEGNKKLPEIYCREEGGTKYALAFFHKNKDEYYDLHLVGARALGITINACDFMQLVKLGYELLSTD